MVVPLGWALWPAGDGSLQLIRDSTVIGTEQHLFSKEVLQNSNTVPWLARRCRSRCISLWISNVCVCVIVFFCLDCSRNIVARWVSVWFFWIYGNNEDLICLLQDKRYGKGLRFCHSIYLYFAEKWASSSRHRSNSRDGSCNVALTIPHKITRALLPR